MAIEVSIVEDDAKLRSTLHTYLGRAGGFRCVSTFGSAEEALASLPGNPPEIVLMDINLPGMNGIQCVARLRTILPQVKVIMLTVFEETDQVFQSLTAGAFGYLVKSTRPENILEAIREVHAGGSPMSSSIARKVVQSFHAQALEPGAPALSEREQQVLELLARGFPYKHVAEQMSITVGTVRTYIQRIYEKLHVHSRTEAVAKYLRHSRPAG
jgi:DNA-binding NarL/FixJ family response regulator